MSSVRQLLCLGGSKEGLEPTPSIKHCYSTRKPEAPGPTDLRELPGEWWYPVVSICSAFGAFAS